MTYDATNISKVAGGDTVEELEVSFPPLRAPSILTGRREGRGGARGSPGGSSIWGYDCESQGQY